MMPSPSHAPLSNFITEWESSLPLSSQLYNSVISLYHHVTGETAQSAATSASSLESKRSEHESLTGNDSVDLKDWKETCYTPPLNSVTNDEEKDQDALRSLTELHAGILALQAKLLDMSLPPVVAPALSVNTRAAETIDSLISRIRARLSFYTDLPAPFMRLFTPPSTSSAAAAAWYRSALSTVEFKHGLELLASRLAYFTGEGELDKEATSFRDRLTGLLSKALVWLKDGVMYQLINYENEFLDRLNRQDRDHLRFRMLVKSCAELNGMMQMYAHWLPFEEINDDLIEVHVLYFRIRNYAYPLPKTDYASDLKELTNRLAFDIQLYKEFTATEQGPEHWPCPPWDSPLKAWVKKKIEEFGNTFPEQGSVLVSDLLSTYQRLIGIRNE